ncbi:MAG: NUDIX domain-containing protein [Treponema sp.]|nr:NUDIX domain-containing protein [Treponema sp.]
MGKKSIACIVFFNGRILIAHRNPEGVMGNRWEFPGGKVESGETDQQAIVREFQEEFGVVVTVGNHICDATFVHNDCQCSLHAYEVFVPHDGSKERYVLTEHTEYKWVDVSCIPSLPFVDSDLKLYPSILEYLKRVYAL